MSNLTHSYHNGTGGYGNLTLLEDPSLCTFQTCDLSMSSFDYIPTLANAFYAAVFALYIIAQLFLGIKHKTWGYMVATVLGMVLFSSKACFVTPLTSVSVA